MSDRSLSSLGLPIATLSALERSGYDRVSDLSNSTPEQLSRDANIPLPASQAVFSSVSRATATPAIAMTQSAASMMGETKLYSTSCAPLDDLLDGGLKRGHILEISGPPGCGKEQIAAHAVKSFVEAHEHVLFVDMQNMVPPATIKRILCGSSPLTASHSQALTKRFAPLLAGDVTAATDADDSERGLDLVHYQALHTPAEFVVFIRTLPAYLEARPSIRLLILNSYTFPFQTLDFKDKLALLERAKQTLARLCASTNLTVIITSQLVSQPLQVDESGDAPRGSKYVMKRAFDDKYYPSGRTFRVLVVPQRPPEKSERETGVIRLLSTPATTNVPPAGVREAKYRLLGGAIQGM
ncbi:P-loop containing nucleoside triphosphate hydrolase protein [Dichomitus squalens]|uniref:P-loop containing nucleoside triphosphate hydrolase protein n=1 Tax=Dichomitus squalens TaxID=114155 RepID=A0A4Q9N2X1_9APHY|nr:P-loop containing nucleoside triphosphate hydrolase protein [Dichomitus squalens]